MDLRTKTVSVVMVTENRANSVRAAVESVLMQRHRDLEIFVVDDGSGDDTQSALAAINDPRLHYVRGERQGGSRARNVALRMAKGDYVAFLETGDRYLPKKLTLQIDYLERHPDVGMVYTTALAVDAAGNIQDRTGGATASGDIYAEVAFGMPVTIALSTVMIRRELLDAVGPFDEWMAYFEDIDLWRRIAKHARVDAIREPTCEVLSPSDSTVGSQDPTEIIGAFAYYVDKVEREDTEVDPAIRGAGVRRLGEHAAASLKTVVSNVPFGDLLLNQSGRHFRPKVSIVIPVHDRTSHVERAIRSALDQTYDNIEVIVVSDGSTDRGATERVTRTFGDRIRYVAQERGGVATALNHGIEEMTGDYFSWLSQEDLYLPEKLELQVRALAQMPDPRKRILYGAYEVFAKNSATRKTVILSHSEPSEFRRFLTVSEALHGCTLLVPRQAFDEHGRFDPALRTRPDYDLWFRMATTYSFVHEPVILLRVHDCPERDRLNMSDVALREHDAMLAGFVEKLSEREVRQDNATSLTEGYFRLARNLAGRGFAEASARADKLARERLPNRNLEGWKPLPEEDAAAEAIARLSENIDCLRRECDRSKAETQEMRETLEVIYRSRSWQLTAPLRYASRLITGMIAR